MTDTATSRYGARQQSQGSNTNTWGDDKLNEALRLFDRGSKGVQSLALTGDQTLAWSNYVATNTGQCAVLVLTGSLSAAANLVVPSVEWQWDLIKNATGQTITVKTAAGAGVAIPKGRQVPVFCDGADCYFGASNYLGAEVATRLDAHEKICAERYGDIKDSFARVHARLDKIIYGLIGLLITMVGWLVINGVPWKH